MLNLNLVNYSQFKLYFKILYLSDLPDKIYGNPECASDLVSACQGYQWTQKRHVSAKNFKKKEVYN